jgi:hypothetical protein
MQKNTVSRNKSVSGTLVNTTYVIDRQERATYMTVRYDRSGARIVLPNIADRWQGTVIGKAKLESLVTYTLNQLWNIVYSEQSHVEHERATHGNMTSVVRIIIDMSVVMLLLVLQKNSNTSCTELILRTFPVKMYDRIIRSWTRRRLLQFVLKDVCMCRDVLDKDGDCSSTCSELVQFKKSGRASKYARLDLSCTDTYENCSAEYDRLMLHLQIVIKCVQLRTGSYSGR